MERPCLSVEALTCARGGRVVLSDVSFELASGAALVLRGPNGVGKTTLLRSIAGLQRPVSGRVLAPPESIAYAAHSDGIKGTLSVTENLEFWAGLFGRREIAPALAAFDLTALAARQAQNLSAGQKRRLGLARLLVTGRPIWVLDEPTVSLDVAASALFSSAIQAHLARGGAAVIATHIDLGIQASTLDLSAYQSAKPRPIGFDEAFL